MRYARSMSKAALARRIVLSWVVVAVIFLIIGLCLGTVAGRKDMELYSSSTTENRRKEADHEAR